MNTTQTLSDPIDGTLDLRDREGRPLVDEADLAPLLAPLLDLSTVVVSTEPKGAAALWATTIEALRAYQAECEAQDIADEDRRRAAEVERGLDDLARECRRLDREAAAKPPKKR